MGQRSNQCSPFLLDPCENFRCKRGKTCKLDADTKPGCVCQEPSECPPSANEFDNVSTNHMLVPVKEMSPLLIISHLFFLFYTPFMLCSVVITALSARGQQQPCAAFKLFSDGKKSKAQMLLLRGGILTLWKDKAE